MNINFELYKVFYHVAKTLSFSKASHKLFISQSAVSQSIKTLEEKLETSLFNRSTKKVTLTHEGNLLLQHIEPAIHLIHHGENNILSNRSLSQGKIRIGASDTICKHILLPYMKAFHEKYPGIHLQITNRPSTKCVHLLKQGLVDFIITNLPNTHIAPSMEVHSFASFRDVFICGEDFSHLSKKTLSLEELSHYPLLMLEPDTSTTKFMMKQFQEKGFEPKPEIELTSIDLLSKLASINLGIALVPDYSLPANHTFHILTLDEPLPERELAIVTHKSFPLSQASKTFIEQFLV